MRCSSLVGGVARHGGHHNVIREPWIWIHYAFRAGLPGPVHRHDGHLLQLLQRRDRRGGRIFRFSLLPDGHDGGSMMTGILFTLCILAALGVFFYQLWRRFRATAERRRRVPLRSHSRTHSRRAGLRLWPEEIRAHESGSRAVRRLDALFHLLGLYASSGSRSSRCSAVPTPTHSSFPALACISWAAPICCSATSWRWPS